MMPLAEQRGDLLDGRLHLRGAGGLGLNEIDARLPHRLRRVGLLHHRGLGIERRGRAIQDCSRY